MKQRVSIAFSEVEENEDQSWHTQQRLFSEIGLAEITGFQFTPGERLAIEQALEGKAVDVSVSRSALDCSYRCLFGACSLLGLGGVPTHVICLDDARSQARYDVFSTIAERLGIKTALVTANSGSVSRNDAYSADIVFVSARERSLDYLRDHQPVENANRVYSSQLQFLRRLDHRAAGKESARTNNALVFALFEDIDLILSEGAMTPVYLYDDLPVNEEPNNPSSKDSIIAASNFFRVFSTYGRVGGFGTMLDKSTAQIFSYYPVTQIRMDCLEIELESFTTPQTETVRSRWHVCTSDQSFPAEIAAIVKTLRKISSRDKISTRIVIERVPANKLDEFTTAIRRLNLNVLIGEPISLKAQIETLSSGECLLVPFSLSRIPETVNEGVEIKKGRYEVITCGFEESFRAELRKRVSLKRFVSECRFHGVVEDNFHGLLASSAMAKCVSYLPDLIKKGILQILIRHKQKESDRHRARTLQALIKYEEEMDDLLAFSG
ncbi:MAG: hypothetical protein KTR18_00320 [Acidiferrobacterales bacterium]|nr:hypothetical protein [Acidiferrobacterales bacterium]